MRLTTQLTTFCSAYSNSDIDVRSEEEVEDEREQTARKREKKRRMKPAILMKKIKIKTPYSRNALTKKKSMIA